MPKYFTCVAGHRWAGPAADGNEPEESATVNGSEQEARCPICGGVVQAAAANAAKPAETLAATIDSAGRADAGHGLSVSPGHLSHLSSSLAAETQNYVPLTRTDPPSPAERRRNLAEPAVETVDYAAETRPDSRRSGRGGMSSEGVAETVDQAVDPTSPGRHREKTRPLSESEEETPAAAPLAVLPGYEVVGILGRGGMGVVYKARQIGLNRIVALKMMLAGGHASPTELKRFRIEAEAVARLQHPHIVQIYEIGEHEGRPYFSLEYADGGSLRKHLDARPLPYREAAGLLETLARAIHYAHQRGIVHRDLKPANILLHRVSDSGHAEPGSRSQSVSHSGVLLLESGRFLPKITDFGLAKRLDDEAGQTRSGAVLGTPSYMAPEQASGRAAHVGPAADIYALGAMLYEFLTGRPPFVSDTVLDTLKQVASEDPVSPTRLHSKVPRDLEVICLKCLRKDPARRYDDAEELAEDLRRFQAGEPIKARPTPRVELAWKWVKRRPAAAGLIGVATLAASIVLALILAHAGEVRAFNRQLTGLNAALEVENQAKEEARRAAVGLQKDAEARELTARRYWYVSDMNLAFQAYSRGNIDRLEELLSRQMPRPGQLDLRGFEWHYLWRLCHREKHVLEGHPGGVRCLAVSKDGSVAASGGEDGKVRLWSLASGQCTRTLDAFDVPVGAVALSSDGRHLAAGSVQGGIKIWDLIEGKMLKSPPGHRHHVNALAFSPDDTLLASASGDTTVGLWDLGNQQALAPLKGHRGPVTSAVFDPKGRWIATASTAGEVRLWNLKKLEESALMNLGDLPPMPRSPPPLVRSVSALAFDGKGDRLAAAVPPGICVWTLADEGQNAAPRVLIADDGPANAVVFSPDGKYIASAADNGTIALWDAGYGAAFDHLKGHRARTTALAFGPDSRTLLSASADQTVRVWEVGVRPEKTVIEASKRPAVCLAFAPGNDHRFAAGFADGTVRIFDGRTGSELRVLTGHAKAVTAVAFSPDRSRLATASADKTVRLWNLDDDSEPLVFEGHGGPVLAVIFPDEDAKLISSSIDGVVKVWSIERRNEAASYLGDPAGGGAHALAISPDKKTLAVGRFDGTVRLIDLAEGKEKGRLTGPRETVLAVAFSPSGETLAAGGEDMTVRLWDLGRGEIAAQMPRQSDAIRSLGFSHDGQTLLSLGGDLKLWDVATRDERATFGSSLYRYWCAALTRDGKRLAIGTFEGTVILLDADKPKPQ